MSITCFGGETLVTVKGILVPIQQISKGQEVLTVDESGDLRYEKVSEVTEKIPTDELFSLDTDFDSIAVTGNHPIYMSHDQISGKEKIGYCRELNLGGSWVNASLIRETDFALVPTSFQSSQFEGGGVSVLTQSSVFSKLAFQCVRLLKSKMKVYDLKFEKAAGYLVGIERFVAANRS